MPASFGKRVGSGPKLGCEVPLPDPFGVRRHEADARQSDVDDHGGGAKPSDLNGPCIGIARLELVEFVSHAKDRRPGPRYRWEVEPGGGRLQNVRVLLHCRACLLQGSLGCPIGRRIDEIRQAFRDGAHQGRQVGNRDR
ncbi:MAG: hypothetical protein AAFQ53_02270 [Bacteroidota bacterium]